MNIEKVEEGKIVYVYEKWSRGIVKATIKEKLSDGIFKINYMNFVDRDGKDIGTFCGESQRYAENIFDTAEEAFDVIDRRNEEKVNRYLLEIKTGKDLLAFALDNCLCGEEYTDYEAIEAYKIKAKELFGIEL